MAAHLSRRKARVGAGGELAEGGQPTADEVIRRRGVVTLFSPTHRDQTSGISQGRRGVSGGCYSGVLAGGRAFKVHGITHARSDAVRLRAAASTVVRVGGVRKPENSTTRNP